MAFIFLHRNVDIEKFFNQDTFTQETKLHKATLYGVDGTMYRVDDTMNGVDSTMYGVGDTM